MAHTALGEQPHPPHALKAPTPVVDQFRVYHALQVRKTTVLAFISALILGHMCPNSGQEPIECPMGFYSSGNTTTCLTCPAGYACLSTSTIPVACSHGYYSLEGVANCTQCEAGNACEDTKSPPRPCDPGTL